MGQAKKDSAEVVRDAVGIPKLQPKKIDGKWRVPLDQKIPDKLMRCPRCDQLVEDTGRRSPDGKKIFKCRNCKIDFYEGKKKRQAYCKRHKKIVTGKDCQKCFQFRLHWQEWKKNEEGCPDCVLTDLTPEGFEKAK